MRSRGGDGGSNQKDKEYYHICVGISIRTCPLAIKIPGTVDIVAHDIEPIDLIL